MKPSRRIRPCRMPKVDGGQLDRAVWAWVTTQILDPDALTEELRQMQEATAAVQAESQRQIAVLVQQIAQTDTQLTRLLDLYLTNGVDRGQYDQRRTELTTVRDHLTAEMQALAGQTTSLTDDEVVPLQQFAAVLRAQLGDLTRDEQRHILDLLDLRVTIALEGEHPIAQVRCRLMAGAAIVPIQTSLSLRG